MTWIPRYEAPIDGPEIVLSRDMKVFAHNIGLAVKTGMRDSSNPIIRSARALEV